MVYDSLIAKGEGALPSDLPASGHMPVNPLQLLHTWAELHEAAGANERSCLMTQMDSWMWVRLRRQEFFGKTLQSSIGGALS